MIYYIVNNDFHVDNIKGHIYQNKIKNCTIIRVPYALKNDCKQFATETITIKTPFRNRFRFWNPFMFYKAKSSVNKIYFSSKDQVVFLTEFDPINQYIIYKAKQKGAQITLLEEGISFYYLYIFKNKNSNDVKSKLKLFYLRYMIGFNFIRYVSVDQLRWLQMKDIYIDRMLLYFNVPVERNIPIEIIENNNVGYSDLNEQKAIFLNQPLYESYLDLNRYLELLANKLQIISMNHDKIYFKFHPRDLRSIKQIIKQKITHNNITFIDDISLEDFVVLEKPKHAYSFFSDALLKLYQQNIKVYFLFMDVPEFKHLSIFKNLHELVKIVRDKKNA